MRPSAFVGFALLAACGAATFDRKEARPREPGAVDAGSNQAAAVDSGTPQSQPVHDAGPNMRPDAGASTSDAGGPDSGSPPPVDAGPPRHPPIIDFGYYRADTKPTTGLSHVDVVKAWSNIAYVDWWADARTFDHDPGTSMATPIANMEGILSRVTGAGLDVMMDVGYPQAWGERLTKATILNTAKPYWSRVKYIFLGDELSMSKAEANARLAELRTAIANVGLAPRPIGVTMTPDTVLSGNELVTANWDFIAIEAYTPICSCNGCGNGTPQQEVDVVAQHIGQQELIIPATTSLIMILQGYDRNGAFANPAALEALNRATWFQMVKGKSRYKAMIAFNWYREGSTCASNPYPMYGHGTSGYPGLQKAHQDIWKDLTGG